MRNIRRPSDIDPGVLVTFDIEVSRKDRKKLEIIESAIHCLARQGIEGTTLEAVAKISGISRQNLIYYFADKSALIDAVIRYKTATAQSIVAKRVQAADTPEKRLFAAIEGNFEWARTYPEQTAVTWLMYHYASFDPKYRVLHDQMRATGAERLAAILQPLVKGGADRKKLVLAASKSLQCVITGALIEAFTTEAPANSLEEGRKLTLATAQLWLKQLKASRS